MTPNLPNGEAPKSPPARPGELADSLRRFRAQAPQDSLAAASDSGLTRAFVQAAVVTGILFAALTAGPYFWDKQRQADAKAAGPDKTDAAPADAPKAETVAAPTPAPGTPAPDATAKKSADPARPPAGVKGPDVLEKLGESGTKAASPKVNPLDKKEDDLLKDLK